MTEMTLYQKARYALAEYKTVDEVKDVRDKAMALRVYAQQAQDRSLEEDAIEARLRAERRLGEMMAEQPKAKGTRADGPNNPRRVIPQPTVEPPPITLAQAGIDKNLAHRARKLARMSTSEFEAAIGKARRLISTTLEEKQEERQHGTVTTLRGILQQLNQLSNLDKESRSLCQLIAERAQKLSISNHKQEENIVTLSMTRT